MKHSHKNLANTHYAFCMITPNMKNMMGQRLAHILPESSPDNVCSPSW